MVQNRPQDYESWRLADYTTYIGGMVALFWFATCSDAELRAFVDWISGR